MIQIGSAKIYNIFIALTKKLEICEKCDLGGLKQKSEAKDFALMWGRVDSNHRTDSRTDLQSVAIATMRLPLILMNPCHF